MKRKALLILLLFVISISVSSFSGDKAGTVNYGDIPAFKMLQTNGTYFSAEDLPKNKPTVLIYFSPDCEHCQVLLNEVFKKMAAFKNVELVLVTFKPVDEVARFEQSYQTYKYPNIKVGTEGNTLFLRMYYRLEKTPFTIVYDKKGKTVCSYRNQTPVDELIGRIKKLG